MNDSEIFKLTSIMSRSDVDKIHFEFQDAYCDVVYCTIERRNCNLLPVMSHSNNSDDALKQALELIKEVEPWDKLIKKPSKEHQPYYHGYCREMLDEENEVVFQNIGGDKFAIIEIHRKDKAGFVYSDKSFPIEKATNPLTFVKDLPDGTQLWTWNTIEYLSGTASEVIEQAKLSLRAVWLLRIA